MADRALEWLEDHKDAAMQADSWESFCTAESQKPMGEYYQKYIWLAKHWEFLHERGYLTWQTVLYPKARAYTDLFESAKIVKQVHLGKGKGTSYPAPEGMIYIAERSSGGKPSIAGNYGGTRSLDHTRTYGDGTPIRQHYGATWHVCYVKPTFDCPEFPSGRNFGMQRGSFEAIRRDDGTILIVANSPNGIGSTWIAILDEGDSLESLLSVEDQEFLARERAAELAAYGEVSA